MEKFETLELSELFILVDYLTNKHYQVYGTEFNYIHNTKYPYFHWFTIDKIRNKNKKLYNKLYRLFKTI